MLKSTPRASERPFPLEPSSPRAATSIFPPASADTRDARASGPGIPKTPRPPGSPGARPPAETGGAPSARLQREAVPGGFRGPTDSACPPPPETNAPERRPPAAERGVGAPPSFLLRPARSQLPPRGCSSKAGPAAPPGPAGQEEAKRGPPAGGRRRRGGTCGQEEAGGGTCGREDAAGGPAGGQAGGRTQRRGPSTEGCGRDTGRSPRRMVPKEKQQGCGRGWPRPGPRLALTSSPPGPQRGARAGQAEASESRDFRTERAASPPEPSAAGG